MNDTYADQVIGLADGFEFEFCTECGGDLDVHIIAPDALGNAHAWCMGPWMEEQGRLAARATASPFARGWRFACRVVKAGRGLATDRRLPRWLRALIWFGVLPIPGPVDNVVLVLAVAVVWVWFRPVLVDAWATVRG